MRTLGRTLLIQIGAAVSALLAGNPYYMLANHYHSGHIGFLDTSIRRGRGTTALTRMEILRAGSELRRIVELEARLTGEADQPRQPEIVVRIRKDFGTSDDDPSAYEELHFEQPQPVLALPAGKETVVAKFGDCDEVLQ